ncbi:MAG TPA: hypothetical protein DCK93_22035 [Blastocatellia bacterium]|jgi:predicted O-methyltransferase YrrM|nr:hypothetical protein [Blastocatellia bacterium]
MIKKPDLLFRKGLRKTARSLASAMESLVTRKHLNRAGVRHAAKLVSYTSKRELEALLNLALACPQGANALEIGSHLGKSACYLASGLSARNGHLYCVDTWQNETMHDGEADTLSEFKQNTQAVSHILTLRRTKSSALCASDISLPLHLVFIDGDHTYDVVRGDFEKIAPWVADDGIVAFHDCLSYKGVSRVIGEVLSSGEWMMLGHVDNLFWIARAKFSQ